MPHATLPSPGLQAFILCGPGVSLNTFTSNPRDLPKALIPIANRPMVWYPLDWCYRMGVSDITLITPYESAPALKAALSTHPALTSLPNPKAEILAPEELLQTTGTGELLRLGEVQRAITRDFVILPCDLVSEVEGSKVIQQWMTLNPLFTKTDSSQRKGGLGVFYPTHGLENISTKKDESDFLATVPLPSPSVPSPPGSLRADIEEIVTSMPTDTLNDKLEGDTGFLRLRQTLLSQHGRVKLRMRHRDAHVYVFPRWIKDFVVRNEKFDSVSEDVLGWWAKAGWQRCLTEKLGLDDVLGEKKAAYEDGIGDGAMADEDIDPSALSSTRSGPSFRDPESPTPLFANRVGSTAPELGGKTPVTVPPLLAYIQPPPSMSHTNQPQPLIRRVDTAHQLAAISLYLARQSTFATTTAPPHPLAHEHKVHPTAFIGTQSRVSAEDCLIAENVKMGIRCNVKESVVGANCEIGNNVRLTKCVLMDGVVVGDGVQMTGCIIGRRARVQGMSPKPVSSAADAGSEGAAEAEGGKAKRKKGGAAAPEDDEERTRLTDCEVAPNFVVEAGTEAKGEKLMAFDTEGAGEHDEEGEDMEDLDDI